MKTTGSGSSSLLPSDGDDRRLRSRCSWHTVRFFHLIDRLAVNVIYWDEWDFLGGLFEDRGWWELFTWQHGPHREGLGYAVIKICAALSSWDTRFEAFVVGGITVVSAGV